MLLDACAKSSRPADALGVFMVRGGLFPRISFGDMKIQYDVFQDAMERQIPFDAYTISSLLSAYSTIAVKPGELEQAFAIVELGRFMNVGVKATMSMPFFIFKRFSSKISLPTFAG